MNTDKKQAFQERVEAEFKERRAELDKIKAKAEKAQAEAKLSLEDDIKVLDQQLDQLQDNINQLRNAGEETWEQLKVGASSSLDELKKTMSNIREQS